MNEALHPLAVEVLKHVETGALLEDLEERLIALSKDSTLEHAMHSLVSVSRYLHETKRQALAERLLLITATASEALIAQKKAAHEHREAQTREAKEHFQTFQANPAPKRDSTPPPTKEARQLALDLARATTLSKERARAQTRVDRKRIAR